MYTCSYVEFQELSTIPSFPFYFRPSQIVTCSSASDAICTSVEIAHDYYFIETHILECWLSL